MTMFNDFLTNLKIENFKTYSKYYHRDKCSITYFPTKVVICDKIFKILDEFRKGNKKDKYEYMKQLNITFESVLKAINDESKS